MRESLRHRVLNETDEALTLCLEDDRGARMAALVGGALAVGALAAGFAIRGSAVPGLVGTGGLLAAVLAYTSVAGRRSTRLTLTHTGFRIEDGSLVPWPAHLTLRGPWLTLGEARLSLHGEEETTREALLDTVRAFASGTEGLDQGDPGEPELG
ncbi:MAG: hypothetical protein AAF602_20490 [Myxococcota bacterium]